VASDQQFFDPIKLPDRTAMEALLLVAEHGGPTMFARIGVIMRRVTIKLIRKMHNAAWRNMIARRRWFRCRALKSPGAF
jgi:hypothetical protein